MAVRKSSQKPAQMRWTPAHEAAVPLVAADDLTNEEIAAAVGVTRRAVDYWRTRPEFAARVEAYKRAVWRGIIKRGIATKQARLDGLTELHQRQWAFAQSRVDHERAYLERNPTARPIPGWETGFAIRRWKVAGGIKVEEYEPDTGLMSEMRATMKQAAQEMGEWTEKSETKHSGSVGVRPELEGLTDEELRIIRGAVQRQSGAASVDGGRD